MYLIFNDDVHDMYIIHFNTRLNVNAWICLFTASVHIFQI